MSIKLDQVAFPKVEKDAVRKLEQVDRELLAMAAGKPAAEAAALARAAYKSIGADQHAEGARRYAASGNKP